MQAEALFKLAMKFVFRKRDDARGFRTRLGPHQRRALAFQRQNRKRACGQKVFFGAALVIALMADGDDDAGLIVLPAMGRDPCPLAQLRTRAIGSHQQTRLDGCPVGERDRDSAGLLVVSGHRGGAQVDAFSFRSRHQCIDQMTVLDHVREGFAGFDLAGECQKRRAGGVFELRIRDHHVEDRLRGLRNLVPDTERLEQAAAGCDDRGRARIAARPVSKCRIGNHDRDIRRPTPDAAPAPAPVRRTRRRR